ncbi:MAG: hypothetical protein ABIB11_03120 [Candidatus Omnitrophota bacterium]
MKKIILLMILGTVLFASSVLAEEEILVDRRQHPDVKALNGNVWIKLSAEGKDMFISGIVASRFLIERKYDKAGVRFVLMDTLSELKSETAVYDISSSLESIESYINRIYSDSENLNIPLFEAYELMCYEHKGIATADQVAAKTRFLRNIYKTDELQLKE